MDNSSWLQLTGICFLGAMSPGPSLALIVNNSILHGKYYGLATSLGHGLGIGFWSFITVIGITELILAKQHCITRNTVHGCNFSRLRWSSRSYLR